MRDVKKTLNEMKASKKAPIVEAVNSDFDYENTELLERADELRKMNDVIIHMNNEDAYYGDWITFGPPDGATEEDFKDIAEDEEYFEDVKQLFKHVYTRYHDDGLFNSTKEVLDFAHEKDNEFGLDPIDDVAYADSMKKDLEEAVEEDEAEEVEIDSEETEDDAEEESDVVSEIKAEIDGVETMEPLEDIRTKINDSDIECSDKVDLLNYWIDKANELGKGLEDDEVEDTEVETDVDLTEDTAVPNAASYDTDQAKGLDELSYLLSTEYEAVKWYDEAVDKIKESGLNQNIIAEVLRGIGDIRKDEEDHIAHLEKLSNLVKEKGAEEVTESLGDTNDGWSQEVQDILENYLDNADKFSYEIKKTVRGAYTGVDTCEDLAKYIKDYLIQPLEEAADWLEYDSDTLNESVNEEEIEEDKPKKIMKYI